MAKGAPNTAPTRQRVLSYLTPRVQDSLFFEEYDKSRSNHPAYGTPHPRTTEFPDHKLCHLESTDMSGDFFRWWYIAEREAQDDYNWEFTKADIGGTKFNAVTRTYVTLRDKFSSTTPAAGAVMPDTPEGVFVGAYVLAERKEIRTNDPKIDSLFVIDQQTFVQKTSQIQIDYDEQFGGVLPMIQTLYYSTEVVTGGFTAAQLFAASTNAYWGLQSTGIFRDGKQISTDWYVIMEIRVIAQSMIDTGRSYYTTMNYSWPGVLHLVDMDIWPRRDGGSHTYANLLWDKERYSGPCKALVTQIFSVTSPGTNAPTVLEPLPIIVSSPFFSIEIGPCLHNEIEFVIGPGPDHPIFEYLSGIYNFPATKQTDWPSSVLASDEVTPYKGGFLRTITTVYAPLVTPPTYA